MAGQMRIDDETYRQLEETAQRAEYRPAEWTAALVDLFRELFDTLGDDGAPVIKRPNANSVE